MVCQFIPLTKEWSIIQKAKAMYAINGEKEENREIILILIDAEQVRVCSTSTCVCFFSFRKLVVWRTW